jgi:endoglucanase
VIAQYAIPGRDHGGPSGGGAKSLEAYKRLVEANAKAIGDAPAMLVVEPDGLALGLSADCVKAAVEIYRKNCPNARIYVDAGHSSWKKPNEVADLLLKGGIAQADGFALNVSAFQWTRDNMAFGDQVIAELAKRDPKLASKQYVIDTSRNGNGPGVDEQGKPTWGDPVRAKNGGPIMNGPLPTTDTGNSHCAAFIWVKGPGHGDNRIHPSGQFGGEAWVKATKNPKLGP